MNKRALRGQICVITCLRTRSIPMRFWGEVSLRQPRGYIAPSSAVLTTNKQSTEANMRWTWLFLWWRKVAYLVLPDDVWKRHKRCHFYVTLKNILFIHSCIRHMLQALSFQVVHASVRPSVPFRASVGCVHASLLARYLINHQLSPPTQLLWHWSNPPFYPNVTFGYMLWQIHLSSVCVVCLSL